MERLWGFVETGAITGHTCLMAGNEFLTVQYLLLLSDKTNSWTSSICCSSPTKTQLYVQILYNGVIRHCCMLYWWLKWTVETCSSVEYHKHTRCIELCFGPIIGTRTGPIKTWWNEVTYYYCPYLLHFYSDLYAIQYNIWLFIYIPTNCTKLSFL